ncbi:MFS transporter [Streptomyces sp. NPDC048297]|uniref:MFS transporter n=1 Tax=Streptomyces sp. NPDC048297 TaxID=3365531 RepID=UPI0037115327
MLKITWHPLCHAVLKEENFTVEKLVVPVARSNSRSWRGRISQKIPEPARDRVFRRYWTASVVSTVGDGVAVLAIPLVATVSLRAGTSQVSLLVALTWLPSLLFSIPAGRWVDRLGRPKEVMAGSDFARFVLACSVALLNALHVLQFWNLCFLVFLLGFFSVLFDVSDISVFGLLVQPEDYVSAQSLLQGGREVAFLLGPTVGGLIVQVVTAPFALLFDGISFLISAALLRGALPASPGSDSHGVRYLPSNGFNFRPRYPIIRSILYATAWCNLFLNVINAVFIVYLVRSLHLSAWAIGLYYSVTALGGIAGSLVLNRMARRIGVGRTLIAGFVLYCTPGIIIPMVKGSAAFVSGAILLQALVSGAGMIIRDSSIGAVFTAVVPNEMRASVRGVFQTISFGMRPVGALAGGLIAASFGMKSTLWVGAAGAALGFVWVARSSLVRHFDIEGP